MLTPRPPGRRGKQKPRGDVYPEISQQAIVSENTISTKSSENEPRAAKSSIFRLLPSLLL